MTTVIMFVVLGVLLILAVPIAFVLGTSGITALFLSDMPLTLLPMQTYSAIAKFLMMAIPFFVLAGEVMAKAGISERLINLFRCLFGHMRGGLSIVMVVASCFYAAISGSGPATVAALGGVLIPAMEEDGYGKSMPSALIAASGSIGIIIPPSIPLVIYASIASVSIADVFLAGIIPGIIMGLFLIITSLLICRKNPNLVVRERASLGEVWVAFKGAFLALLMPVIILGGIYGGIFTPTEAAAVAAVYGILIGLFVYRTITVKELVNIVIDAGISSANVMLIVGSAALFTWFCTVSGISAAVSNSLYAMSGGSQFLFLLVINVILLIAGCFLDTGSALYIFTPVILPVALMLGYKPVVLGVVMVMNLAIGLFTPPVGIDLYVVCGISNLKLQQVLGKVIPFILASLLTLLLTTYIPELSLLLVK